MPKVVSIRFHGAGKAYHFDPVNYELHQGDAVIVETVQGIELGIVADEIMEIAEEKLVAPLKPVLRKADEEDLSHYEENRVKESEAFKIASEKIAARDLEMHLVDVEYTFDNRKIIFYFTADGRVDFRELVKDLAAIFRIRIELRQIGVRDEARMIGGVGICGRELCCCSFLNDFVPVSIKMAKEQSLSMNPVKISGICGRLMCCLKYEQEAYEDAHSRMPKQGHQVSTPEGIGYVESINLLKETVTVRLDRGGENDLIVFPNEQITVIGGKNAKKCPHGGCSAHHQDKNRGRAATAPMLEPEDDSAWPKLDADGNMLADDEANNTIVKLDEPELCNLAIAEPEDFSPANKAEEISSESTNKEKNKSQIKQNDSRSNNARRSRKNRKNPGNRSGLNNNRKQQFSESDQSHDGDAVSKKNHQRGRNFKNKSADAKRRGNFGKNNQNESSSEGQGRNRPVERK